MGDTSKRGLDETALGFLHEVGGRPFVAEMIELFRDHTPERLAAARTALEDGRVDAVGMVAHSLKSSAGQLGCPDLVEKCRRLELLAAPGAGGGREEVMRLLEAIEAEYQRVLPLLLAFSERVDSGS